jgi:hypothetical protein
MVLAIKRGISAMYRFSTRLASGAARKIIATAGLLRMLHREGGGPLTRENARIVEVLARLSREYG